MSAQQIGHARGAFHCTLHTNNTDNCWRSFTSAAAGGPPSRAYLLEGGMLNVVSSTTRRKNSIGNKDQPGMVRNARMLRENLAGELELEIFDGVGHDFMNIRSCTINY